MPPVGGCDCDRYRLFSQRLTAGAIAGVSLALLITTGLWWTYFDRSAASAQQRLETHHMPILAAAGARAIPTTF